MTLYLLILFFVTGAVIWRMMYLEAKKGNGNIKLTEEDVIDRELVAMRKELLAMPMPVRTVTLKMMREGLSEIGSACDQLNELRGGCTVGLKLGNEIHVTAPKWG